MQNDEKPSKPTSFLHLLKKLAYRLMLVTGGLAGVVVLFWAAFLLYEAYGDYQRLSYMTSDNCSKHDSLTQICEAEAGLSYLRRVDIDNKRISVTDIADDAEWDSHRYGYEVFWFEPCEEGVEIETGESWSDGKPVTLTCATKPHLYLSSPPPSRIQVSFTAAVQTIADFDSNGFSISHDYSDTDYSPLLRKHALTRTDIKKARKARLEQEAEEEKSRLDKRKLARQTAAAKRDNCNANNERKKNDFDRAISRARKIMLGEWHISNYCETSHAEYPDWCMRYSFSITNKTKFPIKNVLVGYDKFKRCAEDPAQRLRLTFDATISQDSSSHKLVKFFNPDGEMCTRILDVTFDAAFMPKAC